MEYTVVYSSRRTLGLEIREGKLIVRAPRGTPQSEIQRLLREKSAWIETHLARSRQRAAEAASADRLTWEELEALAEKACSVIPERVRHYAPLIGVHPRKITVRNQRTRWGSCSARGSLNFNVMLMLAPPDVLDSVVVHELCHLKEMNHSARFYQEISRVFPGYDACHAWLKRHGAALLARMPEGEKP